MTTTGDSDPEGKPKEDNQNWVSLHLLLSLYLPSLAMGLGNGLVFPVLPELAKSFDVGVGTEVAVGSSSPQAAATNNARTATIPKLNSRRIILHLP